MKRAVHLVIVLYVAMLALSFLTRGDFQTGDLVECGTAAAMLFPMFYVPMALWKRAIRRRSKGGPEEELIPWPTGDVFCADDLTKSVAIYGKTGSGKSSGSRLGLMRAVMKAHTGMLILCSKPEDREWIERRAAEAGRTEDLIIVAPDTEEKTNLINAMVEDGEDSRGIVDYMMTSKEMITRSKGDNQDPFWERSAADEFYYCIEPIRLALGRVTTTDISRFIASAPRIAAAITVPAGDARPEEIAASRAYRAGFHYEVMSRAKAAEKTKIQSHDFDAACQFWNGHYIALDSKPRSSIEAGMMTTLNVFNMGVVMDKIASETTVKLTAPEEGKILVVDYPVSTHGASGIAIMGGYKFALQKHLLKRTFRQGERIVVIESDEAQNLFNKFDYKTICEIRSHGAALMYLTQSISNYTDALGKDAGYGLASQFGHSIFHVVDPITAKWGSSLVGNAMQETLSIPTPTGDIFDEEEVRATVNQGVRPLLEPREFQLGRQGGRANRGIVDSWVIRSQPFNTGSTFIRYPWRQERR